MQRIKSLLDIENLINYPELPCTVYINMKKGIVEVFEEDKEGEDFIVVPTLDELCPYNQCIGEYVAEMDIPNEISATCYLQENQQMQEFRRYREMQAVKNLELWLKKRDIQIVYVRNILGEQEREQLKEYYNRMQAKLNFVENPRIALEILEQIREVLRFYDKPHQTTAKEMLDVLLYQSVRFSAEKEMEDVEFYITLAEEQWTSYAITKIDEALNRYIDEIIEKSLEDLNANVFRFPTDEMKKIGKVLKLRRIIEVDKLQEMGFTYEMLDYIASEDENIEGMLEGLFLKVVAMYNLKQPKELTMSFVQACVKGKADKW